MDVTESKRRESDDIIIEAKDQINFKKLFTNLGWYDMMKYHRIGFDYS